MALENIEGVMPVAYTQVTSGTALHSDQLMNAKRDEPALRDIFYYVPDGVIYFMDGGRPKLAITREPENPLLQEDVYAHYWCVVQNNHNYIVSLKEA